MISLYKRILIPFFRIKHKTKKARREHRDLMGFSIEAKKKRDPAGTWGAIVLAGDRNWTDPVLVNRKFRTLCNHIRKNENLMVDLRLLRSGTVINEVIISSKASRPS